MNSISRPVTLLLIGVLIFFHYQKEDTYVPPAPTPIVLRPPETYEEAIQQGKDHNRPVMLYFSRKNCPACAKMDPVIESADLSKFVFYKVTENKIKEYNITGVPTVVVGDKRLVGYRPQEEFEQWISTF